MFNFMLMPIHNIIAVVVGRPRGEIEQNNVLFERYLKVFDDLLMIFCVFDFWLLCAIGC